MQPADDGRAALEADCVKQDGTVVVSVRAMLTRRLGQRPVHVHALAQQRELLGGRVKRARRVVGHVDGQPVASRTARRSTPSCRLPTRMSPASSKSKTPSGESTSRGPPPGSAEPLALARVAERGDQRDALDEHARVVARHDDVVAAAVRAHRRQRERAGAAHLPAAVAVGDAEEVEVAAAVDLHAADEEDLGRRASSKIWPWRISASPVSERGSNEERVDARRVVAAAERVDAEADEDRARRDGS